MNFYKNQHKYYCGIDLHARKTCPPLEDICLHSRQKG